MRYTQSVRYPLGVAGKVALSLGRSLVRWAEENRKYSEHASNFEVLSNEFERELPQEALRNSFKSQIT